jgi:hypothetical protein
MLFYSDRVVLYIVTVQSLGAMYSLFNATGKSCVLMSVDLFCRFYVSSHQLNTEAFEQVCVRI